MNLQTELAWHYTTGEKFILIVDSGMLLPTDIGTMPPEKPVLWFSKHPYFEPTAQKTVVENGKMRRLPVTELFKAGSGLIRFGYPTARLFHGRSLRAEARIPRIQWKVLEKVARKQGSNPEDWWGTTESLVIDDLVVEVMNESMEWQRVQ